MCVVLTPCQGCGALFPPHEGPTHRYIGASAACWALLNSVVLTQDPEISQRLLSDSRVPEPHAQVPSRDDAAFDAVFGDAYGVQHHGGDSPQAIQSVALHLLNVHGIVSGKTTRPQWAINRALRQKGVFHRLQPPPLGRALTIRHLFPGGGVLAPITRTEYVLSVYEAWMSLHRHTVEQWYDRYVVPD